MFSWGFQPPQGTINLDPAFYFLDSDTVSVRIEVPSAGISCAISGFLCTARISDRAVKQVRELLELCRQSELDDIGSTGDVEEYERESKTDIC